MNRILSLLLIFGVINANANSEKVEQSDLLLELQQDMQHYSNLATGTKQNVDYMPYVISTLNNKDLVKLGVLNLREAIGLIPGVDLNVGMAGVKNPIFRGSNPYAFGQSRLIIDGMVVNDQIFGGYNQFLEMPIDLIHRIEVVRGPGSMLSHVNGYAGAIHVITKANRDDGTKNEDEGFAYTGTDGLVGGGIVKTFDLGKAKVSTDVYYQTHDYTLPVGVDRYNNAGETDQSLDNYQVGLNYAIGEFEVKGRVSKNDSGVSYGQAFSLTDDDSDFLDVANNLLEVKYKSKINDSVKAELTLDYFDENRQLQNKIMPDGTVIMMPSPMMLPNGRYFLVDYSERTLGQRLEFDVAFSESHNMKLGIHAKQSDIIKNDASISNDDLQTFSEFDLFTNEKRNINTLYIEDMFDIGEKSTAQIGAKLSKYSDEENQAAFRLALVHRYTDEDVFKIMFSQAYREPSWREVYLNAPAYFRPNINLDVEKVDAYELAYIRRLGHRDYFKVNTFYLANSKQIDAQNVTNTFSNTEDNDIYGFELEFESNISNSDVLHINYSYINGSNVSGELANSASHLAQMYYLSRINEKWHASGLIKYAGEKGRVSQDARSNVDSYAVADLTFSYQHGRDGVKINATVKNVLDEVFYLPSPNGTYAGDFEQAGRVFLLRLSKEF